MSEIQKFKDKYLVLSPSSKKSYTATSNKYLRLACQHGPDFIDDLDLKPTTKRFVMTSILHALAQLSKPPSEELFKKYTEKYLEVCAHLNSLPSNSAEAPILYKDLKPKRDFSKLNERQKLICLLYTRHLPRRVQDYQLLRVWKSKNQPPIQYERENANWYIPAENKFIFNKYKTYKTHGQQIVNVDQQLSTQLKKYIIQNKLKNAERIFNLTQPQFTKTVQRIFGVSVNSIRHACVNAYYEKHPDASDDSIKAFADALGHKVTTSLSYRTNTKKVDSSDESQFVEELRE
jgi:hypothetical protein